MRRRWSAGQTIHYPGWCAHRHELLCQRRMDANRLVQLAFGKAAVHGGGKALDDLAGVRANHMHAQYEVAGTVDDDLHVGPLVPARQGMP